MSQTTDVLLSTVRYTRADFTALRANLNRLPIAQIAGLYYTEDDLELLGCQTDARLLKRIEDMRDRLIQSATDANPLLADLLRNARRSGTWSSKLVDFLVHAADADHSKPKRQDPVSAWMKPRVAQVLKGEAIRTLGELIATIETRGSGWWKPIPMIGPGKAYRIEAWLKQHASSLGTLQKPSLPVLEGELVVLSPDRHVMVPIERIALPLDLNGSHGLNRNTSFCLISARHDLDAIDAYLYKFRGQEKTRRAYQKELERFLLWCIYYRRIALSSVLHEDCEAYKDFLANVPPEWIGNKQPRNTTGWRPFAGQLSGASQKYAVQAVRFFFKWLCDVRYLGGNPWATVGDPRVATPVNMMQIEKALPEVLWKKLTRRDGILDQLCSADDAGLAVRYKLRGSAAALSMSAQFRLVRAAMLLMGDCGIRREELAFATRDKLKPIPGTDGMWELDVLGKRNKWRTVFPPRRAVAAIQAHWVDRGQDFSFGLVDSPLLSPLTAPETQLSQKKHRDENGELKESGYSQDGIYKIVKKALERIADDESIDLEDWERQHLRRAAPHAFRHTFGTQAAVKVPLDVVQRTLGHASLQTTTIYVQAEKKRSINELGKLFEEETD